MPAADPQLTAFYRAVFFTCTGRQQSSVPDTQPMSVVQCSLVLLGAQPAATRAVLVRARPHLNTHVHCRPLCPVQAAEQYLRASGLRYTIVRPGGLSDEAPSDVGRLITSGEDTLFGLDTDPGRAISRDTVRVPLRQGWRGVRLVGGCAFCHSVPDCWYGVRLHGLSWRCCCRRCGCCLLQVAEVLVAALRQPAAANRVVEIVSSPSAAEVPEGKWFEV